MATTLSCVLTWTANTEPDLAGYKIYRSLATGPLTLLTSVGLVTTYTDATVPNVDETVGYALTAIDTAGNESPKSVIVTKVFNVVPPQAPVGLSLQ